MKQIREKFSTQVDKEVLESLRDIARTEGRQLLAVVEEAFENLIEDRRNAKARPHVTAAYQTSHTRFSALYEKLAK